MHLRPAAPADQPLIIALIDAVYHEYGDRVCLEGAEQDLLDIDRHYAGVGGAFVVLDDESGGVKGACAVTPEEDRACALRRFYLDASLRGKGWGQTMIDWAMNWAMNCETSSAISSAADDPDAKVFERMELWSDTRFSRAHRFFKKNGFTTDGRTRHMSDGHNPYKEFFFVRELIG